MMRLVRRKIIISTFYRRWNVVNVIFDFIDFYGWIIFIYILVSILINGCFYYFFLFFSVRNDSSENIYIDTDGYFWD